MSGNFIGDVIDAPGRSIFDGMNRMQQREDETAWTPAPVAAIARKSLTSEQIDALNAAFDTISGIVTDQSGDAAEGRHPESVANSVSDSGVNEGERAGSIDAVAVRREALARGSIALQDVIELARGVILGTRAADARTAAEPPVETDVARALSLDELCNDLAQACNRLSRDYTTGLCGHNEQKISAPEWRVLKCMSDWKDEHPQKLLVSTLGIDAGALTRVCQGLENGRGAINREPDARDNRLNNLCLTDQGRKLIDDATPQIAAFHSRLQDAVASGPVLEFLFLLVNLVEHRFAQWSSSDQRARVSASKN